MACATSTGGPQVRSVDAVAPRLPWRHFRVPWTARSGVIATNPGEHRVNDRIRVETVRLIDQAGEQRGIVPTREALALARSMDLDLVEIAPTAQPPVGGHVDGRPLSDWSHPFPAESFGIRPRVGDAREKRMGV